MKGVFLLEKCSCYHTQAQTKWSDYGFTSTTIYQGVCWGTKECEPCSCDGDKLKCDFYDYIRERAYNELKNQTYNKIIRCKDCKVPHNKYTGCPKLNGLVTFPDFYCGFAED